MTRYIDADAYAFPGDLINEPTADVVEVKHGYWKRVRWVKCDDPDGGYWIVRCNQCSIPHFKEYNYCPSCGAKMDVSKMEITTDGGADNGNSTTSN